MAYSEELKRLLRQSRNAYKAMQPDMRHANVTHIQAKKPLRSRLLHAMDNLNALSFSGAGTMELSHDVLFEGRPTVRMCPPAQVTVVPGSLTRTKLYGDTHVLVRFPCEDWRAYNRLSLWIYPDLPTYDNVYFLLTMVNDRPEDLTRSGLLSDTLILQLKHGQWNHVVWEIPNTHRDRMIGLQLRSSVDGRQAGSELTKRFYFGPIHLQEVEADAYEGWTLEQRIAFCHTGYQPGADKLAYTQTADADSFELLDAKTHEAVYRADVKTIPFPLGDFAVMDFSAFNAPGRYALRIGSRETGAFSIGEDAYASAAWKAVNFFYQERCGCALPGTHRVCHLDTFCQHPDGRKISSGGGWHDAGDLSQGLCNTSESAHAMLDLAYTLDERDPELAERLLDEARWGLNWCMKTRFGDGYRARWTRIGTWTGNILGDMDDLVLPAASDPFENFCGAAAEAAAFRMFREKDPAFADYCLRCAEEDFTFALERLFFENNRYPAVQSIGQGSVAAAELYRATGKQEYLHQGAWLLRQVLECQQQETPDWELPIRGFFYEDHTHQNPLNYPHRAHEQAPVLGLSLFYQAAPEHPDAPLWREGLALYGEFIKAIAQHTQPYSLIPGGIYRLQKEDSPAARFNAQIRSGVRLSEEFYLRRMPVADDFRGFHGPLLSKTKSAAAVAAALNDLELQRIVQRQLEWILGMNPFAQSTMYGEGYDFAEQFVMFSHQIVGAIPVGIWTDGDHDMPYFPQMNSATYKEVWVHTTSRFLWVLADVYGMAKVSGCAQTQATALSDAGQEYTLPIQDGRFAADLPQGHYRLCIDGCCFEMDLLSGKRYALAGKED